ncbi:hypothetical protein MKY96_32930 [Paenibacillus sp. FSL R7-0302]|uniref:hypothetical protein n=1 Tax=Paenibacillus sp. FSL R7-0302 TaxID=2921681 RepID=UPI0030F78FD7
MKLFSINDGEALIWGYDAIDAGVIAIDLFSISVNSAVEVPDSTVVYVMIDEEEGTIEWSLIEPFKLYQRTTVANLRKLLEPFK